MRLMLRAGCVALLLVGCGGGRAVPPSADAAGDVGADVDGGWTQCSAPDGVTICGSNGCPDTLSCGCVAPGDGSVSVCSSSPGFTNRLCALAPDGDICVAVSASEVLFSEPYSLGVLFANNGAASRVRYADYGDWTGDPLPQPAGCPAPGGVQLCGPACPACPSDRVCSGRSPLHPYGMCFPQNALGCGAGCSNGTACFAFSVQSDAQAEATDHGLCIASAECAAAVTELPGGATCTP